MSNNKSRWYFTKEALINTPSRKCGMDYDKELSNRQQAANLIQDMGRLLNVNQLCINTAIVYMHRFYVFHSFQRFHRNPIAACALFLAAKVEEQPRKLEYVIKVAHKCLNNNQPPLDPKSEAYQEQAQELIVNENIMLQTLGFDIAIEHPHTFVVKCCQLVRASKDLAQTSYFMATNSLHLTTMCLQYRPTVVACVCIHLACKWSNWEIPKSTQGKDWFFYVDKEVTAEMLEELTSEFLAIWDKCPSRLKRKILGGNASQGTLTNEAITHLTPKEDRKISPVKNETKSKSASTSSAYNQPSTSKTSGQSASTPIPAPSSNKKRSPSPSTKKPEEKPARTHSMPHPSSTSGQSSNIHNSLGMDALNTTLDNRQRSQLKDDKKSTVSKVENKSKPPPPPPSQPPSSSHHSQLSASRQSSEMTSSQYPPLGSNDYDRRSPSPAGRRNEKEMPPLQHRPQANSRSSSGQIVDHNSVSYNTHSGNSSFANESRHRSAFKEERKVSPVKNETKSKPVSSTSGYNQSTSKTVGQSTFVPASISSSNKKRSPSPSIKKVKEEPIRTHSISHTSQGPGQLPNVHNSLGMDALNMVTDNRQRLQSKDDKKHSLLKTETKSKPPPPLQQQPQPPQQPQPQSQQQQQPQQQPQSQQHQHQHHHQQQQPQLPQLQSQLQPQLHLQPQSQPHPPIQPPSLPHSGQLPVLRQSSEMTTMQHLPLGSSDFEKRSPSPVARVNEKEMPPLLHRPQTNSRSSSGQNVDHNSVSYNTHSLGNSSSSNETRPKSAFKVENTHQHQHHHQNKHHHRHHEHKKHHKDKHKRKHKHKDRDREKHRSDHDHEESNHKDKDFKLTIPVPQEEEKPSPIKLKISKKQISYSGSESEHNNEPPSLPPSLRVVISKERLSGNSSIGNHSLSRSETVNVPSTSSSRKRKNSPRDELSFQERDLKIKKEKLND